MTKKKSFEEKKNHIRNFLLNAFFQIINLYIINTKDTDKF